MTTSVTGERVVTAATDHELIVHAFLPIDGERGDAAYESLRQTWTRCRDQLGLTEPIASGDLPDVLPATLAAALGPAEPTVPRALAVIRCRAADGVVTAQAIGRIVPPFLVLSLALAPPGQGWPDLDRIWDDIAQPLAEPLIGEARLYHAVGHDPTAADAPADLARRLARALPSPVDPTGWEEQVGRLSGGLLWELPAEEDAAARRRLLVASEAGAAAATGAWLWSDGTVAPPAVAVYLAHAAALRYQIRVWRRDRRVWALRTQLDRWIDEARWLGRSPVSPAPGPDDRDEWVRALASLRTSEADAVVQAGRLRDMRLAVRSAAAGLAAVLGSAPAGPLARDLALADWFTAQLDQDAESLERAADRARRVAEIGTFVRDTAPAHTPSSRDVFVIFGRDGQLRQAMFELLAELGLNPLTWDTLVERSGQVSPNLNEVVEQGIRQSQAAVALWTPDDLVRLHESLFHPHDGPHERAIMMQPRPNVFLETGMARALLPDRTIIIHAGVLRPVADTAGLVHVQLDGTTKFIDRLVARLRQAGCPVDTSGTGWRDPRRFADLAATTRSPQGRDLGHI